ncbi:putative signal peptide protein [Puccinia sorghi]|uniref:Putative signal peptide protein n=1 Tax=Puccinia sorghi TaxID=27349 RepID=A0A0L6UI08_9BASI|nr:putative signal peptide protein [Puccinia sorghi]
MQSCGVLIAAWLEHAACQLQAVEQVFFAVIALRPSVLALIVCLYQKHPFPVTRPSVCDFQYLYPVKCISNCWNSNSGLLIYFLFLFFLRINTPSCFIYSFFPSSLSDLNSIHLSVVFIVFFFKPDFDLIFFPSFSTSKLARNSTQMHLTCGEEDLAGSAALKPISFKNLESEKGLFIISHQEPLISRFSILTLQQNQFNSGFKPHAESVNFSPLISHHPLIILNTSNSLPCNAFIFFFFFPLQILCGMFPSAISLSLYSIFILNVFSFFFSLTIYLTFHHSRLNCFNLFGGGNLTVIKFHHQTKFEIQRNLQVTHVAIFPATPERGCLSGGLNTRPFHDAYEFYFNIKTKKVDKCLTTFNRSFAWILACERCGCSSDMPMDKMPMSRSMLATTRLIDPTRPSGQQLTAPRVFCRLRCRLSSRPVRLKEKPCLAFRLKRRSAGSLTAHPQMAHPPAGASLPSVNSTSPILANCKSGSLIGADCVPGPSSRVVKQLAVLMHAMEDDIATVIALPNSWRMPTHVIPDRTTGELEVIPDIGIHIIACGSPGRLTAPGHKITFPRNNSTFTDITTTKEDQPGIDPTFTGLFLTASLCLTIGRCCLRWAWVVAHEGACKRGSCRAAIRS